MSNKKVLNLYKLLLREATKFPSYNFRNYALRRIRDGFKANKSVIDSDVISNRLEEATTNLEVIKRQVLIGQFYSTDKLVIEYQNVQK